MRLPRLALALLAAAPGIGALATSGRFSNMPTPSRSSLANPDRYPLKTAYDILGRHVSSEETERMRASEEGRVRGASSACPAPSRRA